MAATKASAARNTRTKKKERKNIACLSLIHIWRNIMVNKADKNEARLRRHRRVRGKISGTAERPRLDVFRSAKHIYCQVIDDEAGVTLASASRCV